MHLTSQTLPYLPTLTDNFHVNVPTTFAVSTASYLGCSYLPQNRWHVVFHLALLKEKKRF